MTSVKHWKEREAKNEISVAMKTYRRHAEAWASDREHSIVVSGPAGIGKTSIIEAVCDRHRLHTISIKPHSYRDVLAGFDAAKQSDAVLILDEADLVLSTHRNLNLMKTALEDRPSRRVYGDVDVNVRCALTTNMDLSDLSGWAKKLRPHVAAVASRSPPFIIPQDRLAVWEFTVCGALLHGCIDELTLDEGKQTKVSPSVQVQNAALAYFTSNVHRLSDRFPPAIRTLRHIATMMVRYGVKQATETLDATLLDRKRAQGSAPTSPVVLHVDQRKPPKAGEGAKTVRKPRPDGPAPTAFPGPDREPKVEGEGGVAKRGWKVVAGGAE